MIKPKRGSLWRHWTGNEYRFMFLANEHTVSEKHPVMVVYRGQANSRIWTRTLISWYESMTEITDE